MWLNFWDFHEKPVMAGCNPPQKMAPRARDDFWYVALERIWTIIRFYFCHSLYGFKKAFVFALGLQTMFHVARRCSRTCPYRISEPLAKLSVPRPTSLLTFRVIYLIHLSYAHRECAIDLRSSIFSWEKITEAHFRTTSLINSQSTLLNERYCTINTTS